MSARGRDLATRMVDLLATALRTLEHLVGSVVLSFGPDAFRLGDVTLASLLARYSGAVSQTSVATIFDDTGRLTACTRVSGPEGGFSRLGSGQSWRSPSRDEQSCDAPRGPADHSAGRSARRDRCRRHQRMRAGRAPASGEADDVLASDSA